MKRVGIEVPGSLFDGTVSDQVCLFILWRASVADRLQISFHQTVKGCHSSVAHSPSRNKQTQYSDLWIKTYPYFQIFSLKFQFLHFIKLLLQPKIWKAKQNIANNSNHCTAVTVLLIINSKPPPNTNKGWKEVKYLADTYEEWKKTQTQNIKEKYINR